ncbi:peptide chain release factor 1 [bacterium]|nr:peptide chain release factor 1 [bacterium]MBT4552292.1 peptide chain release factor 1 [bacterium]
MLEKFMGLEEQFQRLEEKMSDPDLMRDRSAYQKIAKQHADLKEIIEEFRKYKKIEQDITEAKQLLKDPDFKNLAQEELDTLETEKERIKNELTTFLLPKDPNDDKNAILEIRAGTGGEEAALFAYDLYRMYMKYAESKNWKLEILSENMTGIGGLKEVIFIISGKKAYGNLKYESGIHRVQRVPETESSGRIHTSAASVVVFPDVAEEIDIEIDLKELRIDTYRSSGAGGQHVNKTDSAVRITHLPTGVAVACQDQRSQFQNKEKAMRVLKTRLYDKKLQDEKGSEAEARKIQVGSGDRSEKIRTYNFPQGRVTDHRINLTLHALDKILNGSLDEIIEGLATAEKINKMKNQ